MKNSAIDIAKITVIVAAVLLAVTFLLWIHSILLSIFLGFGIGIIALPAVKKISALTKLPQVVSSVILFCLLLALAGGILFILYTMAAEQVTELSAKIPQAIEILRKEIGPYLNFAKKQQESMGGSFDAGAYVGETFKFLASGLKIGLSTVASIGFALIIAFYYVINPNFYFNQFQIFMEPLNITDLASTAHKMATALRQWAKAQLIDMAIVSVLTTIGLGLIGFKYWLVIGLLTGAVAIIPYLGTIAVMLLSLLVSLASDPNLFLPVFIVFFVTQQLEGNFILPIVMKEEVAMPEVVLLAFMATMGFCFGILGIIMAPGLMVVVTQYLNAQKIFPMPVLIKSN